MTDVNEKLKALEGLIGNTPLIEIIFKYKGELRKIYAKAEYFNLTGSIKDRIALGIMKEAYRKGAIKPTDKIAEATSGNTGIAFSAVGKFLGHEVIIYMPDWMSAERKNIMAGFGATVRLVSKEEGGFIGSIKMTEELAKGGGVFLPCQFSNTDNSLAHYTTTGPEIARQLKELGGLTADALVAGVGTGGTVMGVGMYLKSVNPNAKIYPLEPENSPTMSTGYRVGAHRIQGISDEFIPDLVKLDKLDDIIAVDDGDSIIVAQMLSKILGIGVGISSGANFIGAIKAQELIGSDKTIVTIFSDDNKKYLSTDYVKTIESKDGFYSNDIELISYNTVK